MYAEDRNEPGSGTDRFWIRVKDRYGVVTAPVSMSEPGKVKATPIAHGNIAIPHKVGMK